MKILLVEDDLSLGQFLLTKMAAYRYSVDIATDGDIGLELASQGKYGVILLDIMVPSIDGLSICRKLRHQGCQTPILMLTAKDSDEDVVAGLDAGADDYVTKPFEPSQLIARIRALLRRTGNPIFPILTWGELCLNPTLIQVTYQQQVVALSPKEYSLLELFLRHPQRIFSRSAIIDHLWSIDEFPTDAAVTNLVKDLRRRLRAVGMMEELIETVYRLGYRLKTAPKEEQKEKEICQEQEGLVLIDQVVQNFQASLEKRVEVLEQSLRLQQVGNLGLLQQKHVRDEAHRLAGGLGTFGYTKGSDLARAIEYLFMEEPFSEEQLSTQFSQLLADLKQEIANPPVFSGFATPQNVSMPLVLVIDNENPFTQALQQTAPIRGLRVEVVSQGTIDLDHVAKDIPSVILLSLHSVSISGNKLTLLRKLKKQFPAIPVLTLAEQDCLDERVALARLGNVRYLLKPVTMDEVFEAIVQVLWQRTTLNAKVMIVDDDQIALQTLTTLLQPSGIQVRSLSNPEQFWNVLKDADPDMLLLDLEMRKFKGLELCRVVRQDSKFKELPVIFVTAHTDPNTVKQVFEAGADDLISKPVVGSELVTRVMSRIKRSRMRQQRLWFQAEQLPVWHEEVKTDSLIQIVNQHHFNEFLQQEWQRLSCKSDPLSLILCNIDHLKSYNDLYGYQAGNSCWQQVANIVQTSIDLSKDLVARLGNELAIILPNTSMEVALQVVERIQQAIANLQIPHKLSPTSCYVTLSVGITGTIPTQDKSPKDLIAIAKQALYAAKARGRNTYCLYPLSTTSMNPSYN